MDAGMGTIVSTCPIPYMEIIVPTLSKMANPSWKIPSKNSESSIPHVDVVTLTTQHENELSPIECFGVQSQPKIQKDFLLISVDGDDFELANDGKKRKAYVV